MDYIEVTPKEAALIIKDSKSDCIIINDINDGSTSVERVEKRYAIQLINKAYAIHYNKDDYVRCIDLSFEDDNRQIKMLFS